MAHENQVPQFFSGFLFTKIFRSFRLAIQPAKLILAFGAVIVLCLLGWIMDMGKTVAAAPDVSIEQICSLPGTDIGGTKQPTELHCYLAKPENVKRYIKRHSGSGGQGLGVFTTLWHFGSARFSEAVFSLLELRLQNVILNVWYCTKAVVWSFSYHLIYSIIYFTAVLAVISVSSGAICRIAALQFAQEEKPGLVESLKFSWKHFVSLFTTPLVPLCIILFFGLCIYILGLITNIPRAGEIIMVIGLPAAIFASLLITLVLIGTVAGVPLCYPAISFEVSDGFDAISRTFSYIYTKPWRMGLYTAIAAFYGAACYLFVRLCGFLLLFVTHLFLQFGVFAEGGTKSINKLTAIWPEPQFFNMVPPYTTEDAVWSTSLAGFLVYLLTLAVFGLVVSFVISFYFSANTIIYALMRKHVDGTALDDIHTELSSQSQSIGFDNVPEQTTEEYAPESPPPADTTTEQGQQASNDTK